MKLKFQNRRQLLGTDLINDVTSHVLRAKEGYDGHLILRRRGFRHEDHKTLVTRGDTYGGTSPSSSFSTQYLSLSSILPSSP